ncbi:hypothetical protein GCM10010459_02470 [Microbacterium schleiferi]
MIHHIRRRRPLTGGGGSSVPDADTMNVFSVMGADAATSAGSAGLSGESDGDVMAQTLRARTESDDGPTKTI